MSKPFVLLHCPHLNRCPCSPNCDWAWITCGATVRLDPNPPRADYMCAQGHRTTKQQMEEDGQL